MANPRGAIAGTFLAGELLAGEVQYPFDPPELLLTPRLPSLISEPFTSLAFVRPKLELTSRYVDLVLRAEVFPGIPKLELTARQVGAQVPPTALLLEPLLELTGRSFLFVNDVTLVFGQPTLELFAKRAIGFKPGLSPSVPVDWVLTPTTPVEEVLVPTEVVIEDEDPWLIRPTTEVPA